MQEYFQMGGYAPFVWGSYALAAIVLIGLGVAAWRRLAAQRRLVAELERARPARRRRASGAERVRDGAAASAPAMAREHALDDA